MKDKRRLCIYTLMATNIVFIILLAIQFSRTVTLSRENDKLKETVSRQGFAIESLEKQKSSATYIPKYLDSIPDYD